MFTVYGLQFTVYGVYLLNTKFFFSNTNHTNLSNPIYVDDNPLRIALFLNKGWYCLEVS